MSSNDFRIVFMGTPEFAVASLKSLIESGFNVVAVVTAPDKPAGRGQKLQESDVKQYAKYLNRHGRQGGRTHAGRTDLRVGGYLRAGARAGRAHDGDEGPGGARGGRPSHR